ncbi:MAG: hypothetical protein K0U86_18150 [Planctomycetes bacterium]|nr:hypothetical protein [Planctomycetota bacterium]MCH9726829.1 hypothetical protein [Planctomycetota bacterium]MCH9775513.1 hypothetical protein [Planctomycetota bacterium]MCH9791686.1 hypothetical protein [Planctomycetota bacterium]
MIKEGKNRYRMWMNSGPIKNGKRTGLFRFIYEFTSTDGLNWTQAEKHCIQPAGKQGSVIYPYVIQEKGRYYMWHASHVPNGHTEIFCDESADGSTWTTHHKTAAFPASRESKLFDGRYTSTPCVLVEKDRYLLYYSARDLSNDYIGGDGKKHSDGAGVYQHIGVAVFPRR